MRYTLLAFFNGFFCEVLRCGMGAQKETLSEGVGCFRAIFIRRIIPHREQISQRKAMA